MILCVRFFLYQVSLQFECNWKQRQPFKYRKITFGFGLDVESECYTIEHEAPSGVSQRIIMLSKLNIRHLKSYLAVCLKVLNY